MTPELCSRVVILYAGMVGVYDIETHYRYEEGRGVALLSTMERAMGGLAGFASLSPALILDRSPGTRRNQTSTVSATCVPKSSLWLYVEQAPLRVTHDIQAVHLLGMKQQPPDAVDHPRLQAAAAHG